MRGTGELRALPLSAPGHGVTWRRVADARAPECTLAKKIRTERVEVRVSCPWAPAERVGQWYWQNRGR